MSLYVHLRLGHVDLQKAVRNCREPDQLGVVTGCVPRTQAHLEGGRSTRVSWTERFGAPLRAKSRISWESGRGAARVEGRRADFEMTDTGII